MSSVRRLTAILAADVAGYSRLMGADEDERIEFRVGINLGDVIVEGGKWAHPRLCRR
jgi:class 3 adenylate cyclase